MKLQREREISSKPRRQVIAVEGCSLFHSVLGDLRVAVGLRFPIRNHRFTLAKAITGRSAFTLTQLLVVLAIMMVLALLLLPAISSARQKVQQLGCASNMKQCFFGIMLYAYDNDGALVPCLQYTGPGVGITWEGALLTGGDLPMSLGKLVCPAPAGAHPNSYTGYGMNNYLSPLRIVDQVTPPLPRIRKLANPWERFIIIDNQEYATWGYTGALIDYRHHGGANLCFMDGHVEWWKNPIPVVPQLPW